MSKLSSNLGLALAAAMLIPSGAALAQSAGSTQSADAALAALAPLPAPSASSTGPIQGRATVALVITPEMKGTVWTHTPELLRPMYELGDVNNIGQATGTALEDTLDAMALDVHVVASQDEASSVPGVNYILVPTIQRYEEHNQGLTTFAPFVETIVVQWKVMDAKGNTLLLDTVLASSTGELGNNFIAASRATDIEHRMLHELKTKSTMLLQPVFGGQQAQSFQQSDQGSATRF
jgi:hypothetical protein